MARHRLLLVTRSQEAANYIGSILEGITGFQVSTKIVTNGHVDPLQGISNTPDVLLLHCESNLGELEFIAESGSSFRVPFIVAGPANDAAAMRLSIRAGANDYIAAPIDPGELEFALGRMAEELSSASNSSGELTSVVNSCGGSGASFIAANLACAIQDGDKGTTLLVDFDLQFGGLARYIDLRPTHGIQQALEAVEDMDEVSAETYTSRHKSGLRLLAAPSNLMQLGTEISAERVESLMSMLLAYNDSVIVDLPRRLDLLNATILEASDRIILVLQQSIPHLQNALRMLQLINNELGIPKDRILVLLNRFDRRSLIDRKVVADTLKHSEIFEIPNQYDVVSESINSGKPIVLYAKNSAPAKAIFELQRHVLGIEETPDSHSLLGRALPNLLRRLN